jgi:antitoxin Phd
MLSQIIPKSRLVSPEAKMANWNLQEAKTRLTEVIDNARIKGPQIVTLDGVERAAVLSIDDFRTLTAHKPGLKKYLLGGPKFDDFEIERDRDTGREIAL